MHAHEARVRERTFQRCQRVPQEERPVRVMQLHVVVARLDPLDLVDPDASQPPRMPHDEAIGAPRRRVFEQRVDGRTARSHALTRAPDRLAQPREVERLRQVVDRMHFERAQRVRIEGRHEHHRGPIHGLQLRQHLEPVESGHLHVEQHEVGPQPFDRRERAFAVLGLADHFDVGHARAVRAQCPPRQRFVVDEQHAETIRPHARPRGRGAPRARACRPAAP